MVALKYWNGSAWTAISNIAGPPGAPGPAGPGVPAGGTTGQVLTKTSATDYVTAWQAPPGITLPLTQTLTFSPDNTVDIGVTTGLRPRDVFIGRNVTLGGFLTTSGMTSNGGVTIVASVLAMSYDQHIQWGDANKRIWVSTPGGMVFDTWAGWNWRDTSNSSALRMSLTQGGVLNVPGAITGTLDYAGLYHNNFYHYTTGTTDLGNANTYQGQLRAVKAWGGGLTVNGGGSTGFIIGGGVIYPHILGSGESWIYIAREGYWWGLARYG